MQLLIDNASCRGQTDNLPYLRYVRVHFLPKGTTSVLQPLDQGLIACMKKRTNADKQNEQLI